MTRFQSPMIRRRPNTHTFDISFRPAPEDSPKNSQASQVEDSETIEKEISESRVSEGMFSQIRDESLVLLSQGIPHRIERSELGPFQIFVENDKRRQAAFQLRIYHRENPPRKEAPPLPLTASLHPIWVLAVPVTCTLLQFSGFIKQMEYAGIADADKILHGEWWRTVTAMTLHGDSHHLAGNLVSGYIVLNLLHYRIPLAKLAPFIACGAAIANFAVAFTVKENFKSLGFSSFVFATIGCLAVIEFRLMPRESRGMLRRFAPLCGATSLAVFLGLGEHADILGHLYGFIIGLFCGFIPKKKSLRWGAVTSRLDILWSLLYFALFIVAWYFAFSPKF